MARKRYQNGSLFLRGTREKVWVGRWLADEFRGADRHRIRKSAVLGTLKELPTKKLARRKLDELLAPVNAFTYTPTHNITFRELAEKWRVTILPTHKPSSRDSEAAHLKRLCEFFGEIDAREITGESVQRFVNKQTVKPKTLRNMLTTFRLVWKTAFDWGYVDRDERSVLRSVRLPDVGLQHQPVLSAEQAKQIITAAEEPFKSMYWLIAETGIRGGEVCGLGVEDIDLENAMVTVRRSAWGGQLQTPKTANAVRALAISPNLAAHLKQYLATNWRSNPNDLLFCTRDGTPFNNKTVVSQKFGPLLDSLGIDRTGGMGLHALRHGNATLLDRKSVPIAVRKGRLGHSNFSTTMRYTHMVSADDRNLAGELGRVFDPTCHDLVLDSTT